MTDTLSLIQQYATERHELYKLAAKHHLTETESSRLNQLDSELQVLWDRHRRELAAQHYTPYSYSASKPSKAA